MVEFGIERFHRSLREELPEKDLQNLGLAREIIGQWVDYYNQKRLHGGIRYLRPIDYYFANPDKLIDLRKKKLTKARERRIMINRERLNQANRSNPKPSKSLIYA
jgi:hypothetical protein